MKKSGLNKGGSSLKRTALKRGTSTLASGTPLKSNKGLKSGNKGLKQGAGLKQGDKPLKSNTPLKSGDKTLATRATLKQGDKPLKAKSAMKNTPKPMIPEERKTREVVSARSHGNCEICAVRSATDMAHRLAVSQGGKWQPSNILHACRICHSYNHDNPQNSFDNGWHLRSGSDPISEKVLLGVEPFKKDWFYLDDKGGKKSA